MNFYRTVLASACCAALSIGAASHAAAAPATPGADARGGSHAGPDAGPPGGPADVSADGAHFGPGPRADGPDGAQGRGPGLGGGRARGPALPPGLALSEAQQDRIFAIHHAQAPKLRELDKAERRAAQALRTMAESGQFDEARASAQANALGQAIAARALLRARGAAQVDAVLTPQQRTQRAQHAPAPDGASERP